MEKSTDTSALERQLTLKSDAADQKSGQISHHGSLTGRLLWNPNGESVIDISSIWTSVLFLFPGNVLACFSLLHRLKPSPSCLTASTFSSKRVDLPEVHSVVKVPGRGVTHHLLPIRLHQHGLVPELRWHRRETQRREKAVGFLKHSDGVPTLHGNRGVSLGRFACVCIIRHGSHEVYFIKRWREGCVWNKTTQRLDRAQRWKGWSEPRFNLNVCTQCLNASWRICT